ncbi:MAG: response regulator, partial [Thermoanaerobaculia bacterium]|nr:response regulator [Thermoanaerobaculia bacterium]
MTERVAVVEDEAALAEVLQYNLEQEGFDVTVYDRGDDAWDGLREEGADLVLLDLMLPGMDGLEVTRLIRRHDRLSETPILMLTAKAEEVDRIVGLELG